MAYDIRLLTNCDDAVIFWRIEKKIPRCLGFAIEREMKRPDGSVQRLTLHNRKGFEKDAPKQGEHRPSTVWPFQRFWWADHSADLGDIVRYRVTPMVLEAGVLREQVDLRSRWTAWTRLTASAPGGYACFFNRGLVISQFMGRYLEDLRVRLGLKTRKQALTAFKKSIDEHETPIRQFLAGTLRTRLIELLAEARRNRKHVYAALYELDDTELVAALGALGARAHVVLANGSIQAPPGVSAADARRRDQNREARAALRDARVEVFDRFISPGALGHNKFLVVTDRKNERALAAWTGSTNWTATGLCTQTNNGLLITDREVAAAYLAQWVRLRDAASAFPPALADANGEPTTVAGAKGRQTDVWFTRVRKKVDLAAIDAAIEGAREGVLFLMFQPGGSGALGTLRRLRQSRPSLYIKGVVSTLPTGAAEDERAVSLQLETGERRLSLDLDVVQPAGIRHPFATWASTVTRDEFLLPPMGQGVVGYAIVHSKVIVVDPFTNPVVITGSHNFSASASSKNDENFVIVRGNRELALKYSTHILSVYNHYRWLALVDELQRRGATPSAFLQETDAWQLPQLRGAQKRELQFWVR
ncbi:MAG: phospholipase D-like domain-containing protein [Vicinamibacterales bacterium]